MSKTISVEVAKEIVDSKFDIGMSGPFSSSRSGGAGNGYEASAPKEIRDNIVEIDGTYADCNEAEGTIALRTSSGIEHVMPVGNTVYSASISEQAEDGSVIQIGDQLSVIGIKAEDHPVVIAATIIRGEEKWVFEQVKSIYGRANAIKNYFHLFRDTRCV